MIDRTFPSRALTGEVQWELLVESLVRRSSLAAGTYWRVAPTYHRWTHDAGTDVWDAPLDPFAIRRVDPDRVRRFTGRPYPPWRDRQSSFGTVRGGDWDRRPPLPGDGYELHRRLYLADRFEESTLHGSFRAHFVDGVPWTRTQLVRELFAALDCDADRVWHGCTSRSDVLDRCERLDRLYETIASDGYRTQLELARAGGDPGVPGEPARGFLNALEHEIVVDIGRDGTVLFVSGRHRLSIAKLLGLETVPVVVAVRHVKWMDRRDAAFRGETTRPHPDLPSQ